jgi:hypothetical protein
MTALLRFEGCQKTTKLGRTKCRGTTGYAAVFASGVETEMLPYQLSQTERGEAHGSLSLKKQSMYSEEVGRAGSTGIPQKARLQGMALQALDRSKKELTRTSKTEVGTPLGEESTARTHQTVVVAVAAVSVAKT